MATNKTPIFLNAVISKALTIVNADGTTNQDVYQAGADGGAITNLVAASDDVAVILVIKVDDGTTTVNIGEVTVPAGAGTDGSTAAKNLLDATAMPGAFQADGSILLGPSAKLIVAAKSPVTAAKTVYVMAAGGSYSA